MAARMLPSNPSLPAEPILDTSVCARHGSLPPPWRVTNAGGLLVGIPSWNVQSRRPDLAAPD